MCKDRAAIEAAQRAEAASGMDGADSAGVARAPGLQKIERLGAAHFPDGDAIGTQTQRRAHEIGKRDDAILGPERHKVWREALKLARVLDQHDPVSGLRDLGQKSVCEGGLAGRGSAGDKDVAALCPRPA